MNLESEKNYQKLMEALDSLELTEGNRKLAEDYLDMSGEEDQALLSRAEHQDFSKLKFGERSNEYVNHLQKRKRLEEYGRYVRFVAAVGGATAQRVISYFDATAYLDPAQAAAVRAESIAWAEYRLNKASMKPLYETAKKNPQTILDAMDLCWQEDDNTKVLLAAVYLNSVPPAQSLADAKKGQGLLKSLFSREGAEEKRPEVLGAVKIIENDLVSSLSNMLSQASAAEVEVLKRYIEESGPDTPMPAEAVRICGNLTANAYLTRLLAGAAFLSVEHTWRAMAFLKIAIAAAPDKALATCCEMPPQDWFWRHMELLESQFDKSMVRDYVRWCVSNVRQGADVLKALSRMAKQHPDVIRGLLPDLDTSEYGILAEQVKAGNPELYRELSGSTSTLYREKMAGELTQWCQGYNGVNELRRYLLGEEPLEAVLPFAAEWLEKDRTNYNSWRYGCQWQRIAGIRSTRETQMYRRALVMEALLMHGDCFTRTNLSGKERKTPNNYYKGLNKENMLDMLVLLEEEGLSLHYRLAVTDGMYSCFYSEGDKVQLLDFTTEALVERAASREAMREDIAREAKEGSALVRLICVRALDSFGEAYKEALFSCAADTSLQVREALAVILTGHRDWEPEVKALLFSKKSQERELAITVLKRWGAENYRAELEKALEAEKSKKLKTLLGEVLGVAQDTAAEGADKAAQAPEQLAAELLKGGRKRKVAWAYETPFSEVHRADGTPAGEDILQALLVSYADMGTPGVSADAARLAEGLNRAELAVYMEELFGKWLESGAEAKKKWVLYAASIHGRERMVPVLYRQIQEWPEHARGAMAAEAVKALALNGSADALVLVDQIARKFKFRQVKAAAGEALSYAAEQLGISRDELEDKIVPSLGFDEKMEQVFDYGTRVFRVYLNPSLELEVFDGDGKKLKSLPAPGKRDDEEKAQAANNAFKLMKKQLKTVVGNQKLRLEQAMSVERMWTVDKWQEFFVKNPVMHQFAIGLIWGLYEEGALKATFRYMEDGSFNTVDEEEYELPGEGLIGLVHPIELDQEAVAAWKEQLEDYEVTQPIEQLERTVYRLTEEEKGETELTRFGGKLLNGLSLSGKLQGMGWYRGCVLDGGGYFTFYRKDGDIGVELDFSGVFVGDENEEVTVYEAIFYKAGQAHGGDYGVIKKEDKYRLEEVKPRYFSEIVYQLAKATASSQEQLPYPECKDRR